MKRPLSSILLLYAAKAAEIWLHPIAFIQGKRRRPKTFDDLRAMGLLESHPRPLEVEG